MIAVDPSRIRRAWQGRISGCQLGKPVESLVIACGFLERWHVLAVKIRQALDAASELREQVRMGLEALLLVASKLREAEAEAAAERARQDAAEKSVRMATLKPAEVKRLDHSLARHLPQRHSPQRMQQP